MKTYTPKEMLKDRGVHDLTLLTGSSTNALDQNP